MNMQNFLKKLFILFWFSKEDDTSTIELNKMKLEIDTLRSYKQKYEDLNRKFTTLEDENLRYKRYFPINVEELSFSEYTQGDFNFIWMFKDWKSQVFKNHLISMLANIAKDNLIWDSNEKIIAIKYWQTVVLDTWLWLLNKQANWE